VVTIPSENSGFDAAKIALLTIFAMLAFAANSLLCRLALGQQLIDAASFTAVRVMSGAVTLGLIMLPRWLAKGRAKVDRRSAAMLFTYMAFFSFAYVSLSAGTGALILFGAVQLTMFIAALRGGEQFSLLSWAGLALAVIGLVYLVSPGITAPDPMGVILMTIAGAAWGFYSLLGRNVADALEATANNFIFSVPFVIIVGFLFMDKLHSSSSGLTLAVVSGAITSAATVQLSVPAIAALGGVLLLSEQITLRLVVASVATLSGVWIVLAQRAARPVNST
jgi:drug/metabolite transporter (DMT)-like permease